MIEVIRITRVLFSDYELWRISREEKIPSEFMSSKQLVEFYKLYEKQILKFWLNTVPAKKAFDQWIKEKPIHEAMEAIAEYHLTYCVSTIVNGEHLGYSSEEGMKPMSDTYRELLRLSIEKKSPPGQTPLPSA